MKDNPIGELIRKAEAEADLHLVKIKSETAYIDKDCMGNVSSYCSRFTSKKTKKPKDTSNHYKRAPMERLVIIWQGRTIQVAVEAEIL